MDVAGKIITYEDSHVILSLWFIFLCEIVTLSDYLLLFLDCLKNRQLLLFLDCLKNRQGW